MAIQLGINGFGRIGRLVFRQAFEDPEVVVVAINDLISADYAAYLLKYDSVHGAFQHPIEVLGRDRLRVGNQEIHIENQRDAKQIPWRALQVETVIESTGLYLTQEKARAHCEAGAHRVILSAPAKDDTPTYVMGVNHTSYQDAPIVSNASCTTNCLAPMALVIHERFGIRKGLMSTIHATTATQKTVDGASQRDWRGGRCAGLNIIPASTGAAKAVAAVLPQLRGRLTGMAFRVPVADVSVVDFTFVTEQKSDYPTICEAMRQAASGSLQGILRVVEDEVVSMDLKGSTETSIFDVKAGMGLGDDFFKCVAWYDNEMGYATKTIELAKWITR